MIDKIEMSKRNQYAYYNSIVYAVYNLNLICNDIVIFEIRNAYDIT